MQLGKEVTLCSVASFLVLVKEAWKSLPSLKCCISYFPDFNQLLLDFFRVVDPCLQCFDTVGWAAGRASGL